MTPAEIARGFARLVRDRRRALGLTQAAVAAKAGLTPRWLSWVESPPTSRKRGPTLVLVYRLASAMGCKPADLLPGED